MLYIVSTPIGNLKDITFRAVEVLKEVDLIAAEDTRHTRILTKHYDIDTPLTSYFEHNKLKKGEYILEKLKEGKDVALVTDGEVPVVQCEAVVPRFALSDAEVVKAFDRRFDQADAAVVSVQFDVFHQLVD